MSTTQTARPDVYSRITDKIIADLEQGVRTWLRPWNADHAAGKITRPLRHNVERREPGGIEAKVTPRAAA